MDQTTPQAPIDSAASMPPVTPTSYGRHVTPRLIISVIVLLVLAGASYAGIWWWGNQNTPQTEIATFTPRPNPTATWKTYTNTQYGFSFKYPNDYTLKEGKDLGFSTELFNVAQITKDLGDNDYQRVEFTSSGSEKLGQGVKFNAPDVSVGGSTWKTVNDYDCSPGYCDPHKGLYLFTVQGNQYYEIILYPNDGPEINPIFEEILLNFKFTGSITSVSNSHAGLKVTSLSPNAKVSFPLTVTGTVDNTGQNNWKMFEGQAGSAQLYYNYQNKGWVLIGSSFPVNVKDWTSASTTFTTTLNFNNEGAGIPPGTPMKITFTEEDASGMGNSKTVDFPIILK